tara:strand:+ start:261 stop:470 length:210 start_codon:yes stop_codon:yes gene_type:complete
MEASTDLRTLLRSKTCGAAGRAAKNAYLGRSDAISLGADLTNHRRPNIGSADSVENLTDIKSANSLVDF